MPDELLEIDLGIRPADAEGVRLQFVADRLTLAFIDWQENPQEFSFQDVLGFRWQECDIRDHRDGTTYEVLESTWLIEQSQLKAERPEEFTHFKICFNACGMLDVLARSVAKRA